MSIRSRLLDDRFDGSEHHLAQFIRDDADCRRWILQCAGFVPGDADLVSFTARFYGKPDVVCRIADGRLVVIELCFDLTQRHAFKDLAYVLDPASKDVAGIVWICDTVPTSVVAMLRYYAERFRLDRRITLEILVPGRFDALPPVRFTFDPLLRDLRAGTPRPSPEGSTVLQQLTEFCQANDTDEVDSSSLARLLGVSPTWLTLHAARKGRKLRLSAKLDGFGRSLRGADGRFLFDLDHVSEFVSAFERQVAREERDSLRHSTLPLVSARDPRVGVTLMTVEMFKRETPTRKYVAIKRRLDEPSAFFISTSGRGYSLLWPRDRGTALRPHVANDNR
jgi:hypothetical protein